MNMLLLISFFSFVLLKDISAEQCPAKYLRFHPHHTYCKNPAQYCNILVNGVNKTDIKKILEAHNTYRSKIATGMERSIGVLPKASNMLQMEWDHELAQIAQNHADQCFFQHDCKECRMVESFSVGQNLNFEKHYHCPSGSCKLNWKKAIEDWYNEVLHLDKRILSSYTHSGSWGHFTQVIWADTWKIGCGYAQYYQGNIYKELYVCNYGPSGNIKNHPIYKSGMPCKECPGNTCCSGSCRTTGPTYRGLCKVMNLRAGPDLRPQSGKDEWHCDFKDNNPFCAIKNSNGKWTHTQTLSGNYLSATLNGGQTATVQFQRPIKPSNPLCCQILYRKAPALTTEFRLDASSLDVSFSSTKGSGSMNVTLPGTKEGKFLKMIVDLSNLREDSLVSFTFSVPDGHPAHILDIKDILFYKENCIPHGVKG